MNLELLRNIVEQTFKMSELSEDEQLLAFDLKQAIKIDHHYDPKWKVKIDKYEHLLKDEDATVQERDVTLAKVTALQQNLARIHLNWAVDYLNWRLHFLQRRK